MQDYKVKQGDSISSIAFKYHMSWESIWNHAKNSQLKEMRKDPEVLFPGDVIFIPDMEQKHVSGGTEKKHRFKKKGSEVELRLQIMDGDDPLANEDFILEIDHHSYPGQTDDDGVVKIKVPANASKGKLFVGDDDEAFILEFGCLDPVDEVSGVQARLKNLGFDCGTVDGEWGSKSETAAKQFQKEYELQITGEADQSTLDKIQEIYGC